MSAAPDLSDPAVHAAYRRELRQVARRIVAGLVLALLGIVLVIARATRWPDLPELLPLVLIVTALGLMLLGIVRRTRYHLQRMRGLN